MIFFATQLQAAATLYKTRNNKQQVTTRTNLHRRHNNQWRCIDHDNTVVDRSEPTFHHVRIDVDSTFCRRRRHCRCGRYPRWLRWSFSIAVDVGPSISRDILPCDVDDNILDQSYPPHSDRSFAIQRVVAVAAVVVP